MGSIASTYEKKEVMRNKMWLACLKLDYIEWKELNTKGHMTCHE